MANGESDVKLLHGQVKVEAWDLCVDSQDRRKDSTQHRRALVHDFNDGLTLNWGPDYPGGVTIQGNNVRVVGKLEITPKTFKATAAAPASPAPSGVVTAASSHMGTITTATPAPPPVSPEVFLRKYLGEGPIDVVEALSKLFAELEALKQQHAKAQANWRWCKKCRCLFFAGSPASAKECSAGQQHTQEGSGDYLLLHK